MKKTIANILVYFFTVNLSANDTIVVPSNQYYIDNNKKIILTNLDINHINNTWTNTKNTINLDSAYNFVSPPEIIRIGDTHQIVRANDNQAFSLNFTQLPIISLTTNFTVVDEPYVQAQFKMIDPNLGETITAIGIQYRGASTQSYPKKSFEIEFWTDETGTETHDLSLLGMNPDDTYNLQAMYNEPLRFRTKVNNDLWRMIHTIHYQDKEPDAINGIRMKYAELFFNGEYRGVYCVGEKVKRKQLKLKKYKDNTIKGELYKGYSWGASTYTSLPPYNNKSETWGGFEFKYPNEIIDWSNIYNFVNFVINSSDADFYSKYQSKFNLGNAVDYFILLNLLRAVDNSGKNLYVAKYDTNDQYFYVPWDLDGTFGINWDGSLLNKTDDILSNGFYKRLWKDTTENGFRESLKNRWNELKNTTLNHDTIMNLFLNNYYLLHQNGVYEREKIAWPEYHSNPEHIDYMSDWLNNRILYLDSIFNEDYLYSGLDDLKNNSDIHMFPNPTRDILTIDIENYNYLIINTYNNLGQEMPTNYVEKNKISLRHLENGIYYVSVKYDGQQKTFKIIKQN